MLKRVRSRKPHDYWKCEKRKAQLKGGVFFYAGKKGVIEC